MIHKSHSKKELVNIIHLCNINIKNPRQYKKSELIKILTNEINSLDEIDPELTTYLFHNIIDLKHYLMNCNPKKILTIKQKNEVIKNCKRIQQYIRNNYILDASTFDNINDIYKLALTIKEYGDIPSVRRACKGLEKDPNKLYDIKPTISSITQKELDDKAEYKKQYIMKVEFNYDGPFIVKFD